MSSEGRPEHSMFGNGGMNMAAATSEISTAKTPMEAMRVMAKRQELMGGMSQIAQAIVELEERVKKVEEKEGKP